VIVVADSSGLIAALNVSDPEHSAAASALDGAGYVIISPLALTEIDYVVTARASRRTADRVLEQVRARVSAGRARLAEIDARVLGVALSVRRRYEKLRLDLAAAVNVALAADYRTDTILTLDRRDFRTVRPLTGQAAFRLLPDDR
jgi:predicted nucleic acid-binding protein